VETPGVPFGFSLKSLLGNTANSACTTANRKYHHCFATDGFFIPLKKWDYEHDPNSLALLQIENTTIASQRMAFLFH